MSTLAGRGKIVISNLVGTCECIISSSRGNLFVKTGDSDENIELSAKVINNTGIINDSNSTMFYYLWKKKGTNWEPSENQGENTIFLSNDDLTLPTSTLSDNKNLVFTCEVYVRQDENTNYSQVSPITYGEINLETTLRYWMEFNDTEGLKIYKEGSNIYTLTNNDGYYIIQQNGDEKNILGSFTSYNTIFQTCQIGNINVEQTPNRGWVWTDAPVISTMNIPTEDIYEEDFIDDSEISTSEE